MFHLIAHSFSAPARPPGRGATLMQCCSDGVTAWSRHIVVISMDPVDIATHMAREKVYDAILIHLMSFLKKDVSWAETLFFESALKQIRSLRLGPRTARGRDLAQQVVSKVKTVNGMTALGQSHTPESSKGSVDYMHIISAWRFYTRTNAETPTF